MAKHLSKKTTVHDFIHSIGKNVLEGSDITRDEALALFDVKGPDIMELVAVANRVRTAHFGSSIDLCSILNSKSGLCSEDCAFCVQSSFYDTDCPTYPLLNLGEIVDRAREAEEVGSNRFCVVNSGRKVDDAEFEKIIDTLKEIRIRTSLELDCSLGELTLERADALKRVGVSRYNHNIETAKSHFENICTTHSFESRLETLRILKEVGIAVCCGGIIGMGETVKQRVEFAFYLKEMDVECIPINFLIPRTGTPLEKLKPIPPFEALKVIAIFRLIMPDRIIKLAGGREFVLHDLQSLGILAGANGLIVGSYLTTQGRDPVLDLQMIEDLRF